MRAGVHPSLVLALLVAACVAAPPTSGSNPPQAPSESPGAATVEVDASRDIEQLRAALRRAMPRHIADTAQNEGAWLSRARAALDAAAFVIDRPQLMVVVDRNPAVQELRIVLARPAAPWDMIGGSKVSTGQAGRRGYYITPVGVFAHTDGILDYRAQGTFNENHIRGLGLKGARVWDFGWQTAERGWRPERDPGEIRLLMHATDPDYLEQRLGRPASQGCVRIPATMNRFLDVYGVLDADYERAADEDRGIRAVLLPDRVPTPLAGRLLVVVDSAETG